MGFGQRMGMGLGWACKPYDMGMGMGLGLGLGRGWSWESKGFMKLGTFGMAPHTSGMNLGNGFAPY
jgi:hypothetical protein